MNENRHYVSGFFAYHDDAERTLSILIDQGLPRERMSIYTDAMSPPSAKEAKSDNVLKNIMVDGAVGTAVGTGIGALGSVALAATSVTLFVASPVVAPLMLLGWGASIGGLIGAAAGATEGVDKKEGWLSDLVSDAISQGHVVLVVETLNEQEAATARRVMQDSVGECSDHQT
ncbi:hypothetical protein [Nitrincola sp. MINF-07-Sa-05]|uniref:hypothetical protein n=1 Tax=Nitrincola salilacus TaxID=3400273 RepID=UPI003917C168